MDDTAPINGHLSASVDDEEKLRAQALAGREGARLLVAHLQAQAEQSACGELDLFKQVTGQSSLEKALDDARRLEASYARILAQLDAEPADVTVLAGRVGLTTPRGVAV